MTAFIYEKDLTNMKLKILSSPFHTRMVDELSEKYSLRPSMIRKSLMEALDMSLLENLPARYNAWKSDADEDSLDHAIGATLFVSYIPLIRMEDAEGVLERASGEIESGAERGIVVSKGIEEISEMIRR